MLESTLHKAAAELGRRGGLVGGKSRSPAKQAAAAENGQSGGRPREFRRCVRYGSHRFDPKSQRCPCGFRRETAKLKGEPDATDKQV